VLTVLWITLYVAFDLLGWRIGVRVLNPWYWLTWGGPVTVERLLLHKFLPTMVLMTVSLAWVLPWWWVACRDYLRLPQARTTAAVLGCVLLMLALLAEVY
jgi:hypothetical protein